MSTAALARRLDPSVREAAQFAASGVHTKGVHATLATIPVHVAVDQLVERRNAERARSMVLRQADLGTIISELERARTTPEETA